MLFKTINPKLAFGHFDVDEGYNPGLELVLGSLDHDNELLAHLWSNFQGDLLLELLGDGVLYEPAIVFKL